MPISKNSMKNGKRRTKKYGARTSWDMYSGRAFIEKLWKRVGIIIPESCWK